MLKAYLRVVHERFVATETGNRNVLLRPVLCFERVLRVVCLALLGMSGQESVAYVRQQEDAGLQTEGGG